MFTGIVQATGRIARIEKRGGDVRLVVTAAGIEPAEIALGDSICVSGCCLTVVAREGDTLAFDVSNESLSLTTLGGLRDGDAVNLEKALRLSDRLGGHLVSGHVDGVGSIVSVAPDARSQRWVLEAPAALARYIAAKGSICVDGVSLTVNAVAGRRFEVNLIPHTVEVTTFADRRVGDRVNLEADMLARYVERLSQASPHPNPPPHAGEGDERAARRGGGSDVPPHAGEGDERAARGGGGSDVPPHAGEGGERAARAGGGT